MRYKDSQLIVSGQVIDPPEILIDTNICLQEQCQHSELFFKCAQWNICGWSTQTNLSSNMILMSEQFDTICFVKHDYETIKSQKTSGMVKTGSQCQEREYGDLE